MWYQQWNYRSCPSLIFFLMDVATYVHVLYSVSPAVSGTPGLHRRQDLWGGELRLELREGKLRPRKIKLCEHMSLRGFSSNHTGGNQVLYLEHGSDRRA